MNIVNKKLFHSIFLIIIFLSCSGVTAQIYQTKSEVIKKYGTPDVNDSDFLLYKDQKVNENGENYSTKQVYYFKNAFGDKYCYWFQRYEPPSKLNYYLKDFNTSLVKIGDWEWKDNENKLRFSIENESEYIIINVRLF